MSVLFNGESISWIVEQSRKFLWFLVMADISDSWQHIQVEDWPKLGSKMTPTDGRLCFTGVCLLIRGRGYPGQVQWGWGGTYPYPQPGPTGGKGYPKVPAPQLRYLHPLARSDGGRGYPKVSTPQPRYLPPWPGPTGERAYNKVPTPWPRYLPHQPGLMAGYPKVPIPHAKVPTPVPRPRTGQHIEYLIRRGWYASCVHAGRLSNGTEFSLHIYIFSGISNGTIAVFCDFQF